MEAYGRIHASRGAKACNHQLPEVQTVGLPEITPPRPFSPALTRLQSTCQPDAPTGGLALRAENVRTPQSGKNNQMCGKNKAQSLRKKRTPKTTFVTAPFQEGLAGDPLFELECRIPARKADPQDNLHHGPLSGGIGRRSAFRAGMPDSSSKRGSPRQPSSRPPFRRDWPGIRFSSWNAGFQLEKRIPKTTFITAPFQEGLAGDPLFELECRIPARKADPQDNLHHGPLSGGIGWGSAFQAGMPDSSSKSGSPRQPSSRPPFRRDWLGIRFSSWNAGFQLEKRILKTTFITAPFQEGLAGDPLFELDCRTDSSSKSGSPRQASSRPPFRRNWPGIRFSS